MQVRAASRLRFEEFDLDVGCRTLRRAGRSLDLRPRSFDVLVYLAQAAGRPVGKDEILAAVWPDVVVGDESLTRCVSDIRQVLGEHGQHIIKTLPRRGYLFATPVEPVPASRAADAGLATGPADASMPASSARAPAAPAGPGRVPRWALHGVAAAIGAAVVAALWLGVAQPRAARPPLDAALAQSRSIAVLPFADLSEPPAPHLAYAVDDELATDLGRSARLRVLARTSAAVLGASAAAHPGQVGRELDVRYLLAGSVQRVGDAVSINVRLLRADSGELLWSNRFQYASIADLAQRREISARVANVLDTKITLAAISDAQRKLPSQPAVDHWMRGRFILHRLPQRIDLPGAKAELMQARAHFEAALAAEPDSVEALAGLSFTYVCEVIYRWSAARRRWPPPRHWHAAHKRSTPTTSRH